MAFTKMAASEQRQLCWQNERDWHHERGWHETAMPLDLLVELGIDFEHGPPQLYVPVWAHGVWLRMRDEPLDIVRIILTKARDDLNERIMVCTELTLDLGVPRPVRAVAQVYSDLVRQAREKDASREQPSRPDQ